MASWVVRSKLEPSISIRSLLARESLADRLEPVLHSRAAVLHAPAGFGKTSLLASWRSKLKDQSVPVAWLSLDDHDQDLFQFLTYVMEACKAGGLITNSELPIPQSGVSGPPRAIEGAVLTELNKCSGHQVLILDDFHRADGPDNCRFVNQLLASVPSNIHIVISTREYPIGLAFADLRAHDELVEIDQSALQFSEDEIHTYLGSLIESSEPGDWPKQLFARTEGWPIALKTVRRWVTDGASLRETLEQISGRSSDLSDYFLEQVFENLTESEQAFLMKTSILERVNGDLANVLCESVNAWEVLEELERRDLFVQSLDRERTWYRYHRLFSEFLQERMRRRFDGLSSELHRIASQWFQENGFDAEAVQHVIASGQATPVAQLFEYLGGWHYVLQGHGAVLDRALSIVDGEMLVKYPRLWLGQIFLSVRRGEIDRAEELFDQLNTARKGSKDADAHFNSELLVVQSILNVYGDKTITDGEIEQLEALSESLPIESDLMHAVRCNILCAMYAQRGSFDACVAAGDKAIRHFRAMGSVWGETFIYFHEGYACMAQGRLRDAEVLYATGHDLAIEHFGASSDLAAIASAFLAEAAYEKNNIHEATQLLDFALHHIERSDAWLEVYVAAYTTALKLARASSNWDLFAEIKNRANSTASNRGLPRLRAIVEMQALELEQLDSGADHDENLIVRVENAVDNSADHLALRQLSVSVAARTQLKEGNNQKAIELLERHSKRSFEKRLIRSFVSNSILLAVAHWAENQHDAAIVAFEAALSPSLFEGIKRPFIDEGDAIVDVIRDLTRASEKQRGNRLRDRFLAELMMEIKAASSVPHSDQDALSPREQEVLRYLVQGRSNREIGEAIPISINTVKFHVKNIFEKLGVTTRKDAVTASIGRGFS